MGAHNTFDKPAEVKPEQFTGINITEKGINFNIPPCSVISITLK